MDLIEIGGLRLRCIIGCKPEERRDRSDVVIDMRIGTDAMLAAARDDLADGWDYRTAVKSVITAVEGSSCKTVEALATLVARTLITGCDAPYVMVQVRNTITPGTRACLPRSARPPQ